MPFGRGAAEFHSLAQVRPYRAGTIMRRRYYQMPWSEFEGWPENNGGEASDVGNCGAGAR